MISHDIIDVKKYENFIQLFNDVLLNNLSKQFDKSIYLYLKFSLEPVKNLLLVSNVLSHLLAQSRIMLKMIVVFVPVCYLIGYFVHQMQLNYNMIIYQLIYFLLMMLKSFLKNILLIESGLIFVFDHLNIIKLIILMKKDVC